MDEEKDPIEIEISNGIYVDAGIARYIKSFIKMGYSTKMSCSGSSADGHNKSKGNRPFISFERPDSAGNDYEKYFTFLASCFTQINELEKERDFHASERWILWYLSIQPFDLRITSNIISITVYLPLGVGDEKIYEKFDELLEVLSQKDYFNKLSKKKVEDGDEIIQVL